MPTSEILGSLKKTDKIQSFARHLQMHTGAPEFTLFLVLLNIGRVPDSSYLASWCSKTPTSGASTACWGQGGVEEYKSLTCDTDGRIVQCSAVQLHAVQCSAVQCSAVHCSASPGGSEIGLRCVD